MFGGRDERSSCLPRVSLTGFVSILSYQEVALWENSILKAVHVVSTAHMALGSQSSMKEWPES